nr:protein of unknown function (DUF3828) [uncultured bacterium]
MIDRLAGPGFFVAATMPPALRRYGAREGGYPGAGSSGSQGAQEMRRAQILVALLAIVGSAGAACAYDDPRALVEAIYAPYSSSGAATPDLKLFYSAHLRELFTVHAQHTSLENARADASAADPFAFNPFVDAAHPLLYDLKIGEPVVMGSAALVTVSFYNFDHPSLISLALVKEADGWKVDDVTSTGSGQNWMLSWLLLYDPWAVH